VAALNFTVPALASFAVLQPAVMPSMTSTAVLHDQQKARLEPAALPDDLNRESIFLGVRDR
jgi:hypothetical protein